MHEDTSWDTSHKVYILFIGRRLPHKNSYTLTLQAPYEKQETLRTLHSVNILFSQKEKEIARFTRVIICYSISLCSWLVSVFSIIIFSYILLLLLCLAGFEFSLKTWRDAFGWDRFGVKGLEVPFSNYYYVVFIFPQKYCNNIYWKLGTMGEGIYVPLVYFICLCEFVVWICLHISC